MKNDPISHDEFLEVLDTVREELKDDLYPFTSIDARYENGHRFNLYIEGAWDSFEVDANGLKNRIRELAYKWRRELRNDY